MLKNISLAIVLLFTGYAFAQKGTTSLGLTFSGDYTKIWYTGGDGFYKQVSSLIDGKLGFTAGVNVSFQRREKGAFDIGLLYMENRQGYDLTTIDYGVPSYVMGTGEVLFKNHFVSIPMNWLFYFNQGKTRFYSSVGIAPAYFIAHSSHYEINYSNGKTESNTSSNVFDFDAENLCIAGTLSVGFSQYLNEYFELRLAPTYRIITNFEQLSEDVKSFPYFIGLNAGVYYKFNSKSPAQ